MAVSLQHNCIDNMVYNEFHHTNLEVQIGPFNKKREWQNNRMWSVMYGKPHKDISKDIHRGRQEVVSIQIPVHIGEVKGQAIKSHGYGQPGNTTYKNITNT